ncbi:unnamed protein product [Arctogadus glacialis]
MLDHHTQGPSGTHPGAQRDTQGPSGTHPGAQRDTPRGPAGHTQGPSGTPRGPAGHPASLQKAEQGLYGESYCAVFVLFKSAWWWLSNCMGDLVQTEEAWRRRFPQRGPRERCVTCHSHPGRVRALPLKPPVSHHLPARGLPPVLLTRHRQRPDA